MSAIRRHLAGFTTFWLLCQVVSLSALMPRLCCAAHSHTAEGASEKCHHAVAVDHCPMAAADGTPCPAHAGPSGVDEHCIIQGTCDAPAVALASLLWTPGIIADSSSSVADEGSPFVMAALTRRVFSPLSFDTPPPRS